MTDLRERLDALREELEHLDLEEVNALLDLRWLRWKIRHLEAALEREKTPDSKENDDGNHDQPG